MAGLWICWCLTAGTDGAPEGAGTLLFGLTDTAGAGAGAFEATGAPPKEVGAVFAIGGNGALGIVDLAWEAAAYGGAGAFVTTEGRNCVNGLVAWVAVKRVGNLPAVGGRVVLGGTEAPLVFGGLQVVNRFAAWLDETAKEAPFLGNVVVPACLVGRIVPRRKVRATGAVVILTL